MKKRKSYDRPSAQPYIAFTEEMRQAGYTLLVPNMLPMQFKLILQVMRNRGYRMELLETQGPQIAETGLKYVHNDTCYPAVLVIGQFIDALQSGKYDPHRVALMLAQTGGGCRASNYISLLRKALEKAGYGYVPVVSFSLAGIEKHSGFRLTLPILLRMFFGIVYGDVLMSLLNQVEPYEAHPGTAAALADRYTKELVEKMDEDGVSFGKVMKQCRRMLDDFSAIERRPNVERKVRVGVVGEIYVKFSPLGNNNLAQFLLENDAETVVPGLLDFVMYCVYNNLMDHELYGVGGVAYLPWLAAWKYLTRQQRRLCAMIREDGRFDAPTPIEETIEGIRAHMNLGVKMGEGWLLPAEMIELYSHGVKNIVCTQPFGCLPNHICGKGMMKPLRDAYPGINIVAIDYDPGATRVNQENRLKLMLANAAEAERKEKSEKIENCR